MVDSLFKKKKTDYLYLYAVINYLNEFIKFYFFLKYFNKVLSRSRLRAL